MLTRNVCPQKDPTILDEMTTESTKDQKEKLQDIETELVASLDTLQRGLFNRWSDLREEIHSREADVLIAKMHCPSCPQNGTTRNCPKR